MDSFSFLELFQRTEAHGLPTVCFSVPLCASEDGQDGGQRDFQARVLTGALNSGKPLTPVSTAQSLTCTTMVRGNKVQDKRSNPTEMNLRQDTFVNGDFSSRYSGS